MIGCSSKSDMFIASYCNGNSGYSGDESLLIFDSRDYTIDTY